MFVTSLLSLCFFPGLGVWRLGNHGLPASVWTVSDGTGAEEERIKRLDVESNFQITKKENMWKFTSLGLDTISVFQIQILNLLAWP